MKKKITLSSLKLRGDELLALREIKNGANVYSPLLARTLRDVQRKAPDLLTITPATIQSCDGVGAMPYFGAIPTRKGLELIEATKPIAARRLARARVGGAS